jgi:type IV secretion system protein VirB1
VVISAALLACAINLSLGTNVAPSTMEKIILGESGANPNALHVNHWSGPQPHPATAQEAIDTARKFIAAGYDIDLGESQINVRNLGSLHFSLEDAFDPCKNIAGGGAILTAFYSSAATRYGEGQRALLAAISAYNSGNFFSGFSSGYVSRIVGIPDIQLPAVQRAAATVAPPRRISPYSADTVVYTRVDMHLQID